MDRFSSKYVQAQGSKVICSDSNQTTRTTRSGRSKSLSSLSPRRNRHKQPGIANGSPLKVQWQSPGHSSSSFALRPATFNPSPEKPSANHYPISQSLNFSNSPATTTVNHTVLTNGLLASMPRNTFSENNIFSASQSASGLDAVEAMDIEYHQDDEVPINVDNKTPISESTTEMNGIGTVSGNTVSGSSTVDSFVTNVSFSSGEPKSKKKSVTITMGGEKDLKEKSSSASCSKTSKASVENSKEASKSKSLNPKRAPQTQKKKKAIYIVLHVGKVQMGSLTGKATAPVKIYAEKIFIEMETDIGKETFNFRIPCKDLVSCKASLEEAPLVIIARPSPQGAKSITAKYKEKGHFLDPSSEDSGKRDIILHMNYLKMPRDLKLDFVEQFKVRFAEELNWEELTAVQAREILNKPVVKCDTVSAVPSSSPTQLGDRKPSSPIPVTKDTDSPNCVCCENELPVAVSPGNKSCGSPILDSEEKLPQRQYLSPRSSAKKKLSFSQQPKSPSKAAASPSLSNGTSTTDSSKSSDSSPDGKQEENSSERVTRNRRRKCSGNGSEGSREKKPDIFHHQKQMENHITILGKHSKEQRDNLHHHQKLLEEERAELTRHLERMSELERNVWEKDILLNQQRMTMEALNRELRSVQGSVRQLQQELEQERESTNRIRKVQTDLVQTRRALDEEQVVRNLRDQQLQEKEASILELQRLLNQETRAKAEIDAELRQVRDSYQLHQDELQNERISRQNRDRELGDKEAQLEEQRQQLEEERTRRTGLEDELRRLRLEITEERESRITAERELQGDRTRLQEERNSRARELESYEHRMRESERITSEYEQRLQELRSAVSAAQQSLDDCRRLEPRDWILRRDEVTLTDKTLGVGAWGNVVEGRFRGSKVAVKQIHELILSPHNRRLFEREMSIASRCRHPCLLQFIGATNDDGTPLFVTERLDTDLRSILSQRALPNEEIITIASDISLALNYLHLNRPFPIIHRDISSSNVLLWKRDDRWRGKLSDYGAANFMRQSMTTMPGARIYAAPEALTNQQSPKVDVYSFGLLLCEMCIRELPVPQQTEEQIRLVTNGVLRELVVRCVQTEPESRPSMADVIVILDRQNETIQAQELVAINSVSALV